MKLKVLALLSVAAVSCNAQTVIGTITSARPSASIAIITINGVQMLLKEGNTVGPFKITKIVHDGVIINDKLTRVVIGKPLIIEPLIQDLQPMAAATNDDESNNKRFETIIANSLK